MAEKLKMPLVGGLVAIFALLLVFLGNPANMGVCIACFIRDGVGALGLHSTATVQYLRPEIIGIIGGAFIMALVRKEFAPTGGSAPITRFVLGFALMIGALIFLGCPLRMLLRIGGGDLNAIVGLVGFVVGILVGVFFINKGYSLKRTQRVARSDGFALPIAALVLLAMLLVFPTMLAFSTEGPGSMHAPIWASLGAGLIIGAVGFLSRLCFVAGIRDSVLFRSFSMLAAFVVIVIVVTVGNLLLGNFKLGFEGQPIAHTDGLWNFLSMSLVGLSAVLLGGCPFRQVVLAGSGNSDSIVTVLGLAAGAAFAHNFGMASSAAGVTMNGKIGFAILLVAVLAIAVCNTFLRKKAA